MTIGNDEFEDMKNQLSSAINMEIAGLDDFTIKRMFLSYYRGMYFNDTNILIELDTNNNEEMEKARELEKGGYYAIVNGNTEEGKGEDGHKYLQVKGIIKIEQKGSNPDDETLFYMDPDGLKKIYEEEYLEHVDDDDQTYSKSVKKYLEKCYTYASSNPDEPAEMKMYAFNETTKTTEYEHENSNLTLKRERENAVATLQTLDFTTEISKYLTPIEFFVDLMEVTGSKDFINAVMDLMNERESIVLKVYGIKDITTTKTVTEYTQDTLVTGEKGEDYKYEVKKADGTVLSHTVEEIEGTNEVNITVNSGSTDCSVTLYTNDSPETETMEWKEGSVTHTTTVTKTWDLNKDNNWTKTWNNKTKSDKVIKEKDDTSKVTETVEEKLKTEKYAIGVKKVNIWYGSIEIKGSSTTTSTIMYTKNENGDYEEIFDKAARKIVEKEDEDPIEYKDNAYEIKVRDNWDTFYFSDAEYTNSIFNYTIRKPDSDVDYYYEDYDFYKMNVTKTDTTESVVETRERESIDTGVATYVDKTEYFLGLLSNDTGTYYKGAKFKSKSAGGLVIRYPDLYQGYEDESKAGAGELLENGAETLFELLNSSENTKSLVNIMRYIMWLYSGKTVDYGVTELKFQEYDLDNMKSINNSSGFWWPVGSDTKETIDGKLFASDDPVETVITSGVGPRWGTNHGGIDISGSFSIPGPYIIASDGGTVKFATQNGGIYDTGYYGSTDGGGYGNYVVIDHGNGYETYYAHLYKGSIVVSTGDTVEKGQVIGKMGSSGSSTGVHLHFEVRLNGTRVDPEDYVSLDDPRPNGVGGISQELYNFISSFEGGTSYFNQATGEYTVFNNGLDPKLELTCGCTIGTIDGGTYSWVEEILGRSVSVGDTITSEEYDKIFAKKISRFVVTLDEAIAETGAVLTQQQKDAAFSLCYNTGNIKNALSAFNSDGEKGYWTYMHNITRSNGVIRDGLVRRRAEEMEIFLSGDYSIGNVNEGIIKHGDFNEMYGLNRNSGSSDF